MDIKEYEQVWFKFFFDKKTGLRLIETSKAGVSVNEELAQELHKPLITKFKRKKLYARFKDNIWAADLAEMESLSSNNKNVEYLLCMIDLFNKYTWVKFLKDKQSKQFLMHLSK